MANFTDEQIAQLSGNQNVQWVSRTGVQFTPEFKILAWEQKQQGRRMKDIFRDKASTRIFWAESGLRISPSGWMTQCGRADSYQTGAFQQSPGRGSRPGTDAS